MIERNTVDVGVTGARGAGIYCYDHSDATITNNIITQNTGNMDDYHAAGGGLCINYYSNPKITKNVISKNRTGGDGAGIFCNSGFTSIVDNIIEGNESGEDGGGIYCHYDFNAVTISHNTILGNVASKGGGGIYCDDDCSSVITNNRICFNTAKNGGGINCRAPAATNWANNMIYGNIAHSNGGGIYVFLTSTVDIINNTLVGNSAYNGGGINCSSGVKCNLANTILWGNLCTNFGPEAYMTGNSTTFTVDYSAVKGGLSSLYIAQGASLNWGSYVYDVDPLFVDSANHDYHLLKTSPCRNKGDTTAAVLLEDFEGDPRVAFDKIDIGADEQYYHFYCTGDSTPGGVIEGKFIGLQSLSPVMLIIGSGIFDPPMPLMWGDFYLDAPWMFIPVGAMPTNGVLVLPQQIPATAITPSDIPMQAWINEELTNLYVLEVR